MAKNIFCEIDFFHLTSFLARKLSFYFREIDLFLYFTQKFHEISRNFCETQELIIFNLTKFLKFCNINYFLSFFSCLCLCSIRWSSASKPKKCNLSIIKAPGWNQIHIKFKTSWTSSTCKSSSTWGPSWCWHDLNSWCCNSQLSQTDLGLVKKTF